MLLVFVLAATLLAAGQPQQEPGSQTAIFQRLQKNGAPGAFVPSANPVKPGAFFWLAGLFLLGSVRAPLPRDESTASERKSGAETNASQQAVIALLCEASERAAVLGQPLALPKVLQAVSREAAALCRADIAGVAVQQDHDTPTWVWTEHAAARMHQDALNQAWKIGMDANQPVFLSDSTAIKVLFDGNAGAGGSEFQAACIWPLRSAALHGIACCLYTQPQQWTSGEIQALDLFYQHAGSVLQTAYLYETERKQRMLSEALYDVSVRVNTSLDLDIVLQSALDNLQQVLPHEFAEIILLEGETLQAPHRLADPAQDREIASIWQYPLIRVHAMKHILETRQALVIPDVATSVFQPLQDRAESVRSYAGAPICDNNEVIGVINLASTIPGYYQPNIAPVLDKFARQAGVAIGNARQFRSAQQRMNEASQVYRTLEPLFHPLDDTVALAKQITDSVVQEFNSAHCSILLANENRTHLTLVAQSGSMLLQAPELPLSGSGLTVAAVRSRQVIYAPDVTKTPGYVSGARQSKCELVIPLFAGSEVIGVLNLESPHINAFDERSQRLLGSIAERTALGLENARLFATIRQHAEQMNQLNNINRAALQSEEKAKVLQRLVQLIAELMHSDGCYITLWEEAQSKTIPFAAYGPRQEVYTTLQVGAGQTSLTESALRLELSLAIDDVFSSPFISADLAATYPVRSLLVLPLIANQDKMGAVLVGFIEKHNWAPGEIAVGEQVAGQLALALATLRSVELAQQRTRELEALHTATTSLVTTLDFDQLLEQILAAAISAIPAAESGSLHMVNAQGHLELQVHFHANHPGVSPPDWDSTDGPWQQAIQQASPLISTVTTGSGGENYPRHVSLLVAPLIQEGTALGVLSLTASAQRVFTQQDLHLLVSFASTATAAIQNAQLHRAVQQMAVTDPLTGLYNRRGFFDRAGQMYHSAVSDGQVLSAIMLDIDYFKQVNDRFGHDIGDVVLQKIAQRCRLALPEHALVGRYGGEEFCILLPGCGIPESIAAASQLLDAITAKPVETTAGPVSITISIGLAEVESGCASDEELIKRADDALFQAKNSGRGRLCVWQG